MTVSVAHAAARRQTGEARQGEVRNGEVRNGEAPHGEAPHRELPYGEGPYEAEPYDVHPHEADPYASSRREQDPSGEGPHRRSGEPVPVVDRFLRQARRSPGALALIVGGVELTYRELDLASAALAVRLRGLGARRGRVVCIRLEQNAVAVVAMLAALRAGAAWAVVEPDQPASRLRALLDDTDCAVVLAAGRDARLAGVPGAPALLDADGLDVHELAAEGARSTEPPGPPEVVRGETGVPESAPAYVVCTSGSTGAPKGVMVSRRQLATSVAPRESVYGAEHSVFLMAMRMSFDGMLGGMFWSFTRGHTLLLPDAGQLRQVHELARLGAESGATHLIVVPSYYRALLEESRLLPDTLRLVVVAGEPCTRELVRLHQERLPGAALANEYGPTETTISCTVQPGLDASMPRVPIGRAWPGAETRVLDERLREVPPGRQGELYVGGGFVATGYAGQPGRTAERFVADPYGPPGARLYRTGDLVHVDGNGALHYHGRTDQQVKVRGTRIELGEVEEALERHPGVGQAVVLCDDGGDGAGGPGGAAREARLVAFLTAAAAAAAAADGPGGDGPGGDGGRGEQPPSWPELREHCREYVVEQAVPVLFHTLERMPLNTSGKADRPALRGLIPMVARRVGDGDGDADGSGERHGAGDGRGDRAGDRAGGRDGGRDGDRVADGGGETGEQDRLRAVTEIWAAVLGHRESGPHDNFFAVGGTSLRVIDLHKRLEEQWPGVLRVGELFDLTTVAAQAGAVADRLGVRDEAAAEERDEPAAYEL